MRSAGDNMRPSVGQKRHRGPDRFQSLLDHYVHDLGNLSAVAAIEVVGAERHYFASGRVSRQHEDHATPQHLFQIGSQSKLFIAIALYMLHLRGTLSLDHAAIDYVDVPIDGRITLRHLVMNQSGLGEFSFAIPQSRFDPRIKLSPRDLISLAIPQGQQFEPGDRFDYCNTGWVIAALALEQCAEKPFADVISELISSPLGLLNTSFGAGPADRMLCGYVRSAATGDWVDTSNLLTWAFGSGDGISSLDDMVRLFSALIDPERPLGFDIQDLTRETGKPAEAPIFLASLGTEYALGLERRLWAGSEVWGHPGSTYSYLTGTWVDPVERVIVATCVTRAAQLPSGADNDLRYPKAQLFSAALNTAYGLASEGRS